MNETTEVQKILEKILNKPVYIGDTLMMSQSLCMLYLAGEYQEWEKEIKQLAKIHYDFFKIITLEKVQTFAENAHKDQKYGNYPYLKHLQDVYDVLISFKIIDNDLLYAAWLHDILEDTNIKYEDLAKTFTTEIADLVYAVSNEKGENRKERFIKTYPKIKKNLKATILKLADRIANVKESKLNNPDLLKMYKKEFTSFKEEIYNPLFNDHILTKMWQELEQLLNSSPMTSSLRV